jgi:primosomal protein N''
MSIFDAYDQEFRALSQDINKNLSELKNDTASNKASSVRLVEGLLSQCGDLIKQMEVEVRGHDPATRKVLNEKVIQYKKSLVSLKSDFERIKEQSQRSELIGNKSTEHRQRLLDANDK